MKLFPTVGSAEIRVLKSHRTNSWKMKPPRVMNNVVTRWPSFSLDTCCSFTVWFRSFVPFDTSWHGAFSCGVEWRWVQDHSLTFLLHFMKRAKGKKNWGGPALFNYCGKILKSTCFCMFSDFLNIWQVMLMDMSARYCAFGKLVGQFFFVPSQLCG